MSTNTTGPEGNPAPPGRPRSAVAPAVAPVASTPVGTGPAVGARSAPAQGAVLDSAHVGDIQGAMGTIRLGEDGARTGLSMRLKTLLAIVGPGLIVMVGDNDAGAFGTYTQAGQNYGTRLLWTLLLLVPGRAGRRAVDTQQGPRRFTGAAPDAAAGLAGPGHVAGCDRKWCPGRDRPGGPSSGAGSGVAAGDPAPAGDGGGAVPVAVTERRRPIPPRAPGGDHRGRGR